VDERQDPDAKARAAGTKSERLLQDTYLSGAVGMAASGPRLSADLLARGVDGVDDSLVRSDSSWRTGAELEDEPGTEVAARHGGFTGLLRRLFGS